MDDLLARTARLAAQVAHARRVRELAQPSTCCLIGALEALTPADVVYLTRWRLRDARAEAIVDRVATGLGEHRGVVHGVLSDCIRLDVWDHNEPPYAELERRYRAGGVPDAAIERTIGRPPRRYPFLLHGGLRVWRPGPDDGPPDYGNLTIEDGRRAAICYGYLVARGRVYATHLSLLEASVREDWQGWPGLWRWF